MKVLIHKIAKKYLARLPQPDKARIEKAIEGLEHDPPQGDIRQYVGSPDMWRLKEGDYRILYRIILIPDPEQEANTESGKEPELVKAIKVSHIEPRGQAYARKTKNKRG